MNQAGDLKELYRRTVLEHSRKPHHFGRLDQADQRATGHNPLCGDKCTVYVRFAHEQGAEVSFEGTGCAICMASASIMTDAVQGKPVDRMDATANGVLLAFSEQSTSLQGEMAALEGVRDFPSRIRCATLPWKTLQAALKGTSDTVTTESGD